MKAVFTWIILGIAICLATGCDYGTGLEGENDTDQYETQEGELKNNSSSEEAIRLFPEEFEPYEGEPMSIDIAPLAECACDCSANDAACQAQPKCDGQAFAVDIRGTCRQQGDQCGGKCECAHCYMPLGKKCGKLKPKPPGTCRWIKP